MAQDPILAKYAANVPLSSILPINSGLSSASEQTMVSILGTPKRPLTTDCQNDLASDFIEKHLVTAQVSTHIKATGLNLAIASLQVVLSDAFASNPDLPAVLSYDGMLCVRYKKPTSGAPSTGISNHSWGTAIDLKLVGHEPPASTGNVIPKFIAVLVPYFNKAGWYSGIAFHDTMHFEVSNEMIIEWSKKGLN